jgi:hypothetical protein
MKMIISTFDRGDGMSGLSVRIETDEKHFSKIEEFMLPDETVVVIEDLFQSIGKAIGKVSDISVKIERNPDLKNQEE